MLEGSWECLEPCPWWPITYGQQASATAAGPKKPFACGSRGVPPGITLAYGEATNRITTSGYSYDLNGNITAMPGITGIQWDVFDRMTQATVNASTTNYKYDAFGRRVAQQTPNGTNWFFYDMGGRLLATYPWINGNQPVRTAYFAGQRVGQYSDRVGSVRYTAPIVTPPFTYSHYYPFGEEITSTQNDRYKFAETYRDSDSGLDYALNRYYAASIGRFLSADPYKASGSGRRPQSWNRYAYASNDPVNGRDPLGLMTIYNCGFDVEGIDIEDCGWKYAPDGGAGETTVGSGPFPNWATNALNGLQTISLGGFKSKGKCKDFLNELIKAAGREDDLDVDTLMNRLTTAASDALKSGAVYDGTSSSVPLTESSFLDTGAAGATTVGEWFAANPQGNRALSQFDSSAIFVRPSDWSGLTASFVSGVYQQSPNAYGLGVLMHELLHKQSVGGGFTHSQMQQALDAVNAPKPALGSAYLSNQTGAICFQ